MNNDTTSLHLQNKELELLEFYIDCAETVGDKTSTYRVNYGINLAKIVEVIRFPKNLTSFPLQSHEASIGSFNLRGQIVSIIDLAIWLDIPAIDSENKKVIILNFGGKPTGFLVSDLSSIHHLTWADVMAPNEYVGKFSDNTINGVVQVEGKLVFLLDVEQILGSINPELSLKDISPDEYSPMADAGNYTIMIAEDSTPIRTIIGRNLETAGFTVLQASTGKECFDSLLDLKYKSLEEGKCIREYLQVVITDIEMPEMDGYTLTKKIKEDDVLHVLPVILFSSLITDEIIARGRELGAAAQISKPDLPMLAGTLNEIIIEESKKDC